MKKVLMTVAVAVSAGLAGGVVLAQDPALKKCMGCHDMDKKKVGPSFKDVAAKNKGNKDAATAIVAKMKDGKGHPKVAGTDDELKAAVAAALK
ncbi:MAG: cytochrome C biogenesis protein CcsA [Burkholderiales bacterium]|nr:cytochrome C biogenesis protein CcsA [Burkholderiales bacterium]